MIHVHALPDIPSPTTLCAPAPAILRAPGRLRRRFAFVGYRRSFGLRTFKAVSSVATGRIEFVSQRHAASQFYGLSVHFQLLSTPCRHGAVSFSYPAGSSASERLSLSVHAHSQAHSGTPPGVREDIRCGIRRSRSKHDLRLMSVNPPGSGLGSEVRSPISGDCPSNPPGSGLGSDVRSPTSGDCS